MKFHPTSSTIFSSTPYLSLSFGGETKLLKLAIFFLYSAPSPPLALQMIKADFTEISDAWLPAYSMVTFSDNTYDVDFGGPNIYGAVMFNSFEQGALKTLGCEEPCNIRKYALQPRHSLRFSRDEY